ncbi:MAG: NAD(P)-dependent oxidoreductase [Chloroflexi bacterium]|nr:NAD(P)-dependent oxidoreductase [Chloroflexota bacterium]
MSSRTSVVVLGGSGLVGSRLLELWADEFELSAPTHAQLDVLDDAALAAFLVAVHAQVVVNLAAWADVDGAEPERGDQAGRVYALNARYPTHLASLCGNLGKHLVHVSTDYVFDGTSVDRAYREADPTGPLCWYAETKLGGEHGVLGSGAQACVARIEMPFSAHQHPKQDLARVCLARLRGGEPLVGVVDQRITPVLLDDAVRALRSIVHARFTGIIHVAAAGWTTPYVFARTIAERIGLNSDLVQQESFANFAPKRRARRPQHSWLDVAHFAEVFGRDILRPPEAELAVWAEQVLGPPARV